MSCFYLTLKDFQHFAKTIVLYIFFFYIILSHDLIVIMYLGTGQILVLGHFWVIYLFANIVIG